DRAAARRARTAWGLGALGFVFATVLFPLRSEWLNPPTRASVFVAPDGGMRPVDADTFRRAFAPLDDEQRRIYAWSEGTLDGAFPALYAALIILLLRLAWGGPAPASPWLSLWRWATLFVPLAAALSDCVENAALARAAGSDGAVAGVVSLFNAA